MKPVLKILGKVALWMVAAYYVAWGGMWIFSKLLQRLGQ